MQCPQKIISEFLNVALTSVSYNHLLKQQFHHKAKLLLQRIAFDLNYKTGSYDIRSNKGGIAVSGEITLHTDDLYIQISQFGYFGAHGILYRSCNGCKDYTGETNHFLGFLNLRNYHQCLVKINSIRH